MSKPKLYIIKAWNKSGGGIGEYHVVASGINKAKAALRVSNPVIDRVEAIAEREVIVVQDPAPQPTQYTQHRRFTDEYGNTDWRDTGEMGG